MWYPMIVTVLTGYLLGNLNGSVSMSSLLAHDDVRSHGSGNAGLTNFARNYGAWRSVLVALIDIAKAVLACLVGGLLLKPYGLQMEGKMLGGLAVVLGHNFPATLGFRGGKGILCSISVAAVIDWKSAVIIFAVFLVVYLLSSYVSLGSLAGAVTYIACFSIRHMAAHPWVAVGGIVLGLLAIFMHRGNIVRLCKGEESKSPLFHRKEKK